MYSFPNFEPVCCVPCLILTVASWPAYRFLRRQVRWSVFSIVSNYELTANQKKNHWKCHLTLCNKSKPFLDWIVICNEKWILYNWRWPAQWLDQEEAPKHFPRPNLHQKRSWSLFGGLLPIWSTTAFWIQEKPLHLKSILSKSKRCTENCNACS